jgi:hypothetical protein
LIGFLISAAFVYGLAVFAAVVFLTYMIADLESREPIIEYVNVVEETIDNVCNRIDGCRIFWDRTGKEICPDCE